MLYVVPDAVAAVDDGDRRVGDALALVQRLDRRGVPGLDRSEEDVGETPARSGESWFGPPSPLVGDRRRGERPWDLEQPLQAVNWSGVSGASLAPKSTVRFVICVDAAAATDRPVGDLEAERRVDLRDPGLHELRHERAAGAGQARLAASPSLRRRRLRAARAAIKHTERADQCDGLPAQVCFLPFGSHRMQSREACPCGCEQGAAGKVTVWLRGGELTARSTGSGIRVAASDGVRSRPNTR